MGLAVGNFPLVQDATQETLPEPGLAGPDAFHFDQINTHPEDHADTGNRAPHSGRSATLLQHKT